MGKLFLCVKSPSVVIEYEILQIRIVGGVWASVDCSTHHSALCEIKGEEAASPDIVTGRSGAAPDFHITWCLVCTSKIEYNRLEILC